MIATKKMIFAISTETIATPAKPSTPAISATMRNVTAQPSMVKSSLSERNGGRTLETTSARRTFAPEKGSDRPFDRRRSALGRNQGAIIPLAGRADWVRCQIFGSGAFRRLLRRHRYRLLAATTAKGVGQRKGVRKYFDRRKNRTFPFSLRLAGRLNVRPAGRLGNGTVLTCQSLFQRGWPAPRRQQFSTNHQMSRKS
jgi:hypothetical protein